MKKHIKSIIILFSIFTLSGCYSFSNNVRYDIIGPQSIDLQEQQNINDKNFVPMRINKK